MVVHGRRVQVGDQIHLPEIPEPGALVETDVEGDPVPVVVPLVSGEQVGTVVPEQPARTIGRVAHVGGDRPPVGVDLEADVADLIARTLVLQGEASHPAPRELGQRGHRVVARQRGPGGIEREVLRVRPLIVARRAALGARDGRRIASTRLPVRKPSSAHDSRSG
jgi:hypothetical protein